MKIKIGVVSGVMSSVFQALRLWGRRERKRHAKSLHFLNSADPTVSEPGTDYVMSATESESEESDRFHSYSDSAYDPLAYVPLMI